MADAGRLVPGDVGAQAVFRDDDQLAQVLGKDPGKEWQGPARLGVAPTPSVLSRVAAAQLPCTSWTRHHLKHQDCVTRGDLL